MRLPCSINVINSLFAGYFRASRRNRKLTAAAYHRVPFPSSDALDRYGKGKSIGANSATRIINIIISYRRNRFSISFPSAPIRLCALLILMDSLGGELAEKVDVDFNAAAGKEFSDSGRRGVWTVFLLSSSSTRRCLFSRFVAFIFANTAALFNLKRLCKLAMKHSTLIRR